MAEVSAGNVPTSWTFTTRIRIRNAVSASGVDRPRSASSTTPNALRSPKRAATPSEFCTSASAAPRDWLPPLATTLTVAAIPCSPATSREARTPSVWDARMPPFCEARTPDGARCCVFCTPPGAFRVFLEGSLLLKGFSLSNGSGLGSCTKGWFRRSGQLSRALGRLLRSPSRKERNSGEIPVGHLTGSLTIWVMSL
eukprot:1071989-Pyramimonas_sp.AAC.1